MRSYVREYVLHKFGAEQPKPIHQNTFLGRVVRMVVEKQPYRQLRRSEQPVGVAYMVSLPTSLKHYTITPESGKQIGEMLEKFFLEQLISFVIGQVAATGNERKALRSFCKLYNIDPSEADLEVLRKAYRDYKDNVLRDNGQHELLYGPGREELFSDYAIAS
jgi:hypothetical protein